MTMIAQKFKILLEKEKGTGRGSALVNLSDTKQDFTVPRGKQSCLENGLCNPHVLKICTLFLYLCLLLIDSFQLDMILSIAFSLETLGVQNWMPDHDDNINLDEIVFDDQIVERSS